MGWRGPLGSIGEHVKKRRRGGASEQGCPKTGSGGAASLEAGEFAGETWRGQGAEDHRGRNEVEKTRWGEGVRSRRRLLCPESQSRGYWWKTSISSPRELKGVYLVHLQRACWSRRSLLACLWAGVRA